jgi:hypothetical protein
MSVYIRHVQQFVNPLPSMVEKGGEVEEEREGKEF